MDFYRFVLDSWHEYWYALGMEAVNLKGGRSMRTMKKQGNAAVLDRPPSRTEVKAMVNGLQDPRNRLLGLKWLNRSEARLKHLKPRAASLLELSRHPEKGVTPSDEKVALKIHNDPSRPGYRIIEPLLMLKWRHGNNAQAIVRRAAERMGIRIKSRAK